MPSDIGAVFSIDGPREATVPLVLDSPHSGNQFPADFDAIVSETELREGEDSFVDDLYQPATALGVPLLAARFPRTYLDPNRHRGDVDLELLADAWPHEYVPSGKARIGKALVWRTLDDGRPIYGRRLRADEVVRRIERMHAPYHAALLGLIESTHRRFGVSYHINCHSMNAVSGRMAEGDPGKARADFVLGDRDGTSCAPEFTEFVRRMLAGFGYDVRVNDPYKGVELVKAYSRPACGRHSLQIEINKRLYMEDGTFARNAGYATLRAHLLQLVEAIRDFATAAARRVA
jgi:N-formylglutamate amidohydrolase